MHRLHDVKHPRLPEFLTCDILRVLQPIGPETEQIIRRIPWHQLALDVAYPGESQRRRGRARVAGFVLLYGTTFAINVGTNALMLAVLPAMPLRVSAAWVIAQGLATVINFVMLRTVVFRD